MAEIMSIDNNIDKHDIKNDSDESIDSGPEGEPSSAGGMAHGSGNNNGDNQPIKRKGGRKPIYATSEERKQRNRQAQAAFRERRTEYIKQLEETIRVHEQNLHNLQTAHRHAADECLMLRYKNSLLERILLEKGIDVQAELHAKTGSPNLGPTHMPQNLVQPPPLPRAILNRHHARRSNSSITPKLDASVTSLPQTSIINANPGHPTPTSVVTSPKSRPTPSSHSGSPTASTSGYGASPAPSNADPSSNIRQVMNAPPPPPPPPPHQVHAAPSAAAAMKAAQMGAPLAGIIGPVQPRKLQQQLQQQQQQQQQRAQQRQQFQQQQQQLQQQQQQQQQSMHPQHLPHPHLQVQQSMRQHPQQVPPRPHHAAIPSPQSTTPRAGGVSSTPFYPVTSFQNHMEQLEREYDAADDIMEDQNETPDTPSVPVPDPYSSAAFSTSTQSLSLASPTTTAPSSTGSSAMGGAANAYPTMTQLLDPALDWDPFGLSASMQFPTQFSFDTSNTR